MLRISSGKSDTAESSILNSRRITRNSEKILETKKIRQTHQCNDKAKHKHFFNASTFNF